MGGEAHGEVASKLAVQTILTHCRQAENSRATPIFGESSPDVSERTNRLASAIHLANRKVFETAAANAEQQGHGSDHRGRVDRGAKTVPRARGRQPGVSASGRLAGSTDGRSFAGGRKSARRNPDAAGSRCERNAKRVDARGGNEQHGGGRHRRTGVAGRAISCCFARTG